jgi:hypothetical protein
MQLDFLSSKPGFIYNIFDKDISGNYTNKAHRYQYIINFFLNDENRFFKITEIQDILFKVPIIFNVDLSKNPSDIRKNQNRQFNTFLTELKDWKIITSNPAKSIKGETNTKEYKLSKFGKTLALIIEFILSDKKQENYNELFNYWKIYLNDQPASLDLFCLVYLDKCKERGLFDEFADFFVNSILYRNQYIRNNIDLFTSLILVKFKDEQKNKDLFEVWRKSIDELDEKTRELFLNHMSIHINRMIAINAYDFAKYELKRYKRRYLSDCVIAEFCCTGGHSPYHYIEISVFSYMSYVFNQPDFRIKKILKDLKCETCKENKFFISVVE